MMVVHSMYHSVVFFIHFEYIPFNAWTIGGLLADYELTKITGIGLSEQKMKLRVT